MKVPSICLITGNYLYAQSKGSKVPTIEETEPVLKDIDQDKLREAQKAYAGVGIGSVSFGYSCKLKKLYKANKIKLLYSFYGGKLDKSKVSIEHIIPHSKGGINSQKNYVLCNTDQNFARGNNPIETYLDWKAVGLYLDQFRGVKIAGFDGDQYIKDILNSLSTALKTGK